MINVLARDVFLNALLVFMALVVILLLLVNPPSQKSDVTPPGNLIVTIVWPEGDVDVDLWLIGPDEPRPIGYSNKSGKEWSLLRDDLGNKSDSMPLNLENAFSRAVKAGHYVFNLHLYRGIGPIPVTVEIRVANMDGGQSRVLLTTKVNLAREGQEVTAVQFDLTSDGVIVPGSVNNVFSALRSNWVQQ